MITVKDIALRAGVSQGTVSNVLNHRGNVSAEKIQRVMTAAKELGYVANAQAKQLRKDNPLSPHVAIILPNIDENRYTIFSNGIKLFLEEHGYSPLLFITDDSPYKEKQIATHVAEMRVSGVVTVTSSITGEDIYQDAQLSGAEVVYAFRDVNPNHNFVGFDFSSIGKRIADFILSEKYHRVAVISDPDYYPESREFVQGLREHLQSASTPCRLQIKTAEWINIAASPMEFFEGAQRSPDVIVLTNDAMLRKVQLAFSVSSKLPCPPIICLSMDSISVESPDIIRFTLDYMQAGMQTAKQLVSNIERKKTSAESSMARNILHASGFRPKAAIIQSHKSAKLNILISKSQSSTALQRIVPAFTRETGIDVQFTELLPYEVFPEALRAAETGEFDLVRNNMSVLSLFPSDIFYTFNDDEFADITRDMIPRIVKDFSYIHNQKQAIPYDIGIDMLAYRKDIFENPLLCRIYFEQTGKQLAVPSTFDECANVVRFFSKSINPHSPVQAGTGMNWDSPTELSSSFFVRYINYIKNKNLDKTARIEEEAVFKTLSNMYLCGEMALPVRDKRWIGATLDNFIHGQTAIEFIFLNYASNISLLQKNVYGGQIGYTTVPGGTTYITGGSLSIFKESKNIEAAKAFIMWISSYAQAELITLYGGLSPYADVYHNSDILAQYPWYSHLLDIIESAHGRELWELFNVYRTTTLPMPILRSVVQGRKTPEEALPEIMRILESSLLSGKRA